MRGEDGRMPRGLAFFANPLMPTWLAHTLASLFLHQVSQWCANGPKPQEAKQGRVHHWQGYS